MIHNTLWKEALKHTNIIRPRIRALSSIEDTKLPYIFLAQSAVNPHTCVVRQGNVIVKKPTILLPPNLPQLKGFELQEKPYLREFLLVRGIIFPSLKYANHTKSMDVYEGDLEEARSFYLNHLQRKEDVQTGLLIGLENLWVYSVLVCVFKMISLSLSKDIKRILNKIKEGGGLS